LETDKLWPPPRTALCLGAFGVLPFAALTVAAWIANEAVASVAMFAVIAYGAVILSFLAGAHWGFASTAMKQRPEPARRLLIASVAPSLVGWVALLLPVPWSAAVLAAAFIAILLLDHWAARCDFAPCWWLRLRIPLSATVATLLVLVFASVFIRFGP
jgi:hypothetical protein